jgi:hypothetical protein
MRGLTGRLTPGKERGMSLNDGGGRQRLVRASNRGYFMHLFEPSFRLISPQGYRMNRRLSMPPVTNL